MLDVDLAFPLSAGLVAAVNPCGFAMLPAYLAYFMGLDTDDETNTNRNILRALVVGLTLTAGFVMLFGVVGLLTTTIVDAGAIEQRIPYATFGFGILMVPLGVAMFFGFEPKLNIPRLDRGGDSRQLPSIFMFGVSYAIVSISCTAPIFFGAVIGSFTRDGTIDGLAVFLAYSVGMSLVILTLTLAMAMARTSVAANMRRVLPYVNRISGVMLAFAGVFLTIYGWWEIQVLRGNLDSNYLVDRSEDLRSRVNTWVNDVGANQIALAFVFIIGGALLYALRGNLGRHARMSLGAFGAAYLAVELGVYRGDFLVLPFMRTLADVPERLANWFTDPFRWPVTFEALLAALVVLGVWFWVRRQLTGAAEGQARATRETPTVSASSSQTS